MDDNDSDADLDESLIESMTSNDTSPPSQNLHYYQIQSATPLIPPTESSSCTFKLDTFGSHPSPLPSPISPSKLVPKPASTPSQLNTNSNLSSHLQPLPNQFTNSRTTSPFPHSNRSHSKISLDNFRSRTFSSSYSTVFHLSMMR